MSSDKGQPYILINEAQHSWTEGYVRDKLMPSDSAIENDRTIQPMRVGNFLARFSSSPEFSKDNIDKMQEAAMEMELYAQVQAQKLGLNNVQFRIANIPGHVGMANTSKEGTHYVMVDAMHFVVATLVPEAKNHVRSIVSHELAHISNGDTSPAGRIRQRSLAEGRKAEMMADLVGQAISGVEATVNADAFRGYIGSGIDIYNRIFPDKPVSATTPGIDGMKRVSEWLHSIATPTHPPLFERMSAIEIQGALSLALENNAMRPGKQNPDSKAEREQWVIDRIMKQAQQGELPEPARLKLVPTATMQDILRQMIEGRGNPGTVSDTVLPPPATPPAPATAPARQK